MDILYMFILYLIFYVIQNVKKKKAMNTLLISSLNIYIYIDDKLRLTQIIWAGEKFD